MSRITPNPEQPGRCPSIDPLGTLQCGRRIHDDDQCQFGGIAWRKGEPPHVSDKERGDRLEAMCDRMAGKLAAVQEVAARLESLDSGNPGVIGWHPASVMASEVAREIRAALDGGKATT